MGRKLNYLVAVGALCGACGGESNSNRQASAGSADDVGVGRAEPSGGAEGDSGGHDPTNGGRAPGGASGSGGRVVGFGGAGSGGAALGGDSNGDAVQTFHLPSTDPPIGVSGYRASYTSSAAFPVTLVDGYLTIYPCASMQQTGGVFLELETEDGERVVVAGAFDTTDA